MALIDETLPEDPVHADVVLHVRRHLRRAILERSTRSASALALLFGLDPAAAGKLNLERALESDLPIRAAADLIASRGSIPKQVVSLGHDAEHVARCKEWLLERKRGARALNSIVATDLRTLLAVSRAIDLGQQAPPQSAVAAVPLPILIEGATGTGKELLAKAIHAMSGRTGKFVVAQVAGFPKELIHDELFGHGRGSFTGAAQARDGRVQEADGGTLLIDEVGDLPPIAQVGLLRFLQDHNVSRIGENAERGIDVRVIAATWHNLDKDVERRREPFRLDLLHRLRVERLYLPPVRDRENVFTEVVPELLRQLAHTAEPLLTRQAQDALALHKWDGNLRELTGVLRSAVASSRGATVRLEDLPAHIQHGYVQQPIDVRAPGLLCDEFDGQPLEAEMIAAKMARLVKDFENIPAPEAPAPVAGLAEFFKQIPDPSEDHQATKRAIEAQVSRVREVLRLQKLSETWNGLAAASLPADVQRLVELELAKTDGRLTQAEQAVETSGAGIDITKSPWVRLHNELAQLPLAKNADPGQFVRGIIGLIALVYSVAPELAGKLKALLQEGGIGAIRRKVAQLMEEEKGKGEDKNHVIIESEVDPALPEVANHKLWKRRDWELLVGSSATLTEAARRAGLSDKTLRKYLRIHKVGVRSVQKAKPRVRRGRG